MGVRITSIFVLAVITFVYSDSQTFHANTRYGKRAESEMSQPEKSSREGRSPDKERFFLGSRYGKRHYSRTSTKQDGFAEGSQPSNALTTINQPSIRNDRFFIGSRYGKRDHIGKLQRFKSDSSESSNEQETDDLVPVFRVMQPPCLALN